MLNQTSIQLTISKTEFKKKKLHLYSILNSSERLTDEMILMDQT